MKTFKTTLATAALSLAICASAYAGDIHTPGAPPPPPPPPPTTQPLMISGPIALPSGSELELVEFALDMLLSAFSF